MNFKVGNFTLYKYVSKHGEDVDRPGVGRNFFRGIQANAADSDYEVKATICYGGQTASGIFTFNEQCEYVSFTTNDTLFNAEGVSVDTISRRLCHENIKITI